MPSACDVCQSPRYIEGKKCACCRSNSFYRNAHPNVRVDVKCQRCSALTWLVPRSKLCKPCMTECDLKVCKVCGITKSATSGYTAKFKTCKECRAEAARPPSARATSGWVYILIDPRSHEIRYVGITISIKKRLEGHLRPHPKDQSYRARWVRKLLRLGMKPRMRVLQELPKRSLGKAERYWIAHFKSLGCPLVNATLGGEDAFEFTTEVREKMSASAKKRWAGMTAEERLTLQDKMMTPQQRRRAEEIRQRWLSYEPTSYPRCSKCQKTYVSAEGQVCYGCGLPPAPKTPLDLLFEEIFPKSSSR